MRWHDGSTNGGHGYIVITISVLFDITVLFSDEEYFLIYGENVCVQSIVEKPSLYIIGRCPSNDQQLLYSDIRLEDISLLRENLKTSDSIPIRDKMGIFKGDSPARQFEAGQQRGNFFAVLAVFKGISRQIFDIHCSQKASVYKNVSIK